MGVLSCTYAVPVAMMKKIRANNETLGFVFGDEQTDDPSWKVDSYEYDKTFEDRLKILREAGYPSLYQAFDFESSADDDPEYGGYDIRVAGPTKVKKIAREIADVTLAELTAKCLAKGTTSYEGAPLSESELSSYMGDLEAIKAFFAKAADDGHYVIAAAI